MTILNFKKDLVLFGADSMFINDKGKKQAKGLPLGWSKIEKTTLNPNSKVICCRTGKISGITVIDFDNKEHYEQAVNNGLFNPNEHPIVKTKKGFHIFFKYTEDIVKSIPEKLKELFNVDIQNDGKYVYYPGTEYTDQEGKTISYQFFNDVSELKEMPIKLKEHINQIANMNNVKEELKEDIIEEELKENCIQEELKEEETENDKINKKYNLKFIDLISDSFLETRNDWLKIVFALKRENYDLEFVYNLSKKPDKFKNLTKEEFLKDWNSEKGKQTGVGFGTIMFYAQKSNTAEYKKLMNQKFKEFDKKYKKEKKEKEKKKEQPNLELNEVILSDIVDPILHEAISNCTEVGLAIVYNKLKPNDFVYVDEEKAFYTWVNNKKWKQESKDTDFDYIRNNIKDVLKEAFENTVYILLDKYNSLDAHDENIKAEREAYRKTGNKCADIVILLQKTNWLNNIIRELRAIVRNIDKKIEFDMNPNYIGFDNKKYDFVKKEFTDLKQEDYISMSTNYDWEEPKEDDTEVVKKYFEQIFPNENVRKTYLSILYQGYKGGKKDQFCVANGDGSNGKGLLNEQMLMSCGDYGVSGHTDLVITKMKSGANPEVANLHKIRFGLFSELPEDETLKTDNIKKLVDNESINARGLYEKRTKTILHLMIVVEVNKRLKLDKEPQNSEVRRLMDVFFESTFTNDEEMLNNPTLKNIYQKNAKLKDQAYQKKLCCAFFKYIVDNAEPTIYMCDEVKQRTNEYLQDNKNFDNWLQEKYIFVEDESLMNCIKAQDMYEEFTRSAIYANMKKDQRPTCALHFKTKFIKENPILCYKYKDQKRIEGKNYKNRIWGIKINDDDSDEED